VAWTKLCCVSTAILHLADVHYGAAAGALPPELAATLHRERLAALEAALRLARERRAAAVLIAGDLIEARFAVREHAAALAAAFARCPVPVVVVPGNHDPASPGSYYRTYPWPANVAVVAEERWTRIDLPGASVHALGWTGGALLGSPLGDLSLPRAAEPQILLLHADLDPPGGRSAYRPISRAGLLATGAAYAALGHIHAPTLVTDGPRTVAAYPGSLTPLGFGEPGPHGALWVEIGPEGARAEPLALAPRSFRTMEIACGEGWGPADVAAAARALPADFSRDLIRIRLVGASPAEPPQLDGLGWHVEVRDETEPAYDLDALAAEDPRGLLARFIAAMRDLHDPSADAEVAATLEGDPDPDGTEPAPSAAALALRYGVQALTGRRLHPL